MDIWMMIGIIGIATDGIKLDIYILYTLSSNSIPLYSKIFHPYYQTDDNGLNIIWNILDGNRDG